MERPSRENPKMTLAGKAESELLQSIRMPASCVADADRRARQRSRKSPLGLAFLMTLTLSACSPALSPSQPSSPSSSAPAEFGSPNASNEVPAQSVQAEQSQLLEAQASRAKKVEIIFSARVKKILRDDTRGLPHQRLLLAVDNGSTVLLAHDIKYAPKVPVQVGDLLTIKGEYIWNPKGGVVHWTHRSDTPRHEGGYVELEGQRYE